MPKDKHSLLNEANLLTLRISEIYIDSFEIHKNLLKDGYKVMLSIMIQKIFQLPLLIFKKLRKV
jgi:hypothetical protein